MTASTMHQFAQDKVAQDQVEGRSPMVVGFDFGVVLPPHLMSAAGEVVDLRPVSTSLDSERLRQDFHVSRMEDRGRAWQRLRNWLRGARHGR